MVEKMVPRTRCYGSSSGLVAAGMMPTWSVGGAEKVLFSASYFFLKRMIMVRSRSESLGKFNTDPDKENY